MRLKICQHDTETTYVNRHDATKYYDFVCAYDKNQDTTPTNQPSDVDTEATKEEEGASALSIQKTLIASTLLAAAIYLE